MQILKREQETLSVDTGKKALDFKTLLIAIVGAFFYASFISVLLLKWVSPPTTSFMLQYQLQHWWSEGDLPEVQYEWTPWDDISRYPKLAAVASEDQNFVNHWGFDFGSIQKSLEEYSEGDQLRGASTISQQVAKNLYLWPGQSFIRKGIEAYFTLLIELLWSKERILEMYLNIAEFGAGIYGVTAASETFYNTAPSALNEWQGALMMTALPSPRRYNLHAPSNYMLERTAWIIRYMDFLGGETYLNKIST